VYVDDIPVKDALICVIIRSPVARGKIKEIRCPQLEDGYLLISAADIPGENFLPYSNIPIITKNEVSYFGEPVALIVGPDRSILDKYAGECSVEIEWNEPDFSLWGSKEELPPNLIFYQNETFSTPAAPKKEKSGETPDKKEVSTSKSKDASEKDLSKDAPKDAAKDALKESLKDAHKDASKDTSKDAPKESSKENIIEGLYETRIQYHWYSEPHGAIAGLEYNEGKPFIVIKTASQMQWHVKRTVAKMLKMSLEDVEVANFDLGIHFDGKTFFPSHVAALAALAAFKTGKTVKLQFTRERDYLFAPKRTPSAINIKSAVSKEGDILETSARIKMFLGAYAIFEQRIINTSIQSVLSVYKLGKCFIDAFALKKNLPPTGPFAGYGSSIASYTLERHISHICDSLDVDGIDWRKSHISPRLKEALGFQAAGAGAQAGGTAGGQGRASRGNVLFDILEGCAISADYKRKWASNQLLRRTHREDEELILPLRGIGLSFAVSWEKLPENYELNWASALAVRPRNAAACVVEVEIDKISYESIVRHIWFVCGVRKPETNKKSTLKESSKKIIRRSIVAALGWASTEKINFKEGKIFPPSCAFYQMPVVSETPEIHINSVELPGTDVADESSLEELPFSTVPAAYAQAISQAIDYHFCRIPITGEDIWNVFKSHVENNA